MAKLKKLLIGALSMCMAVSMAACGNTGNGDNSNGGNSTTGGSESKWDGKKTDFTLQIFTGGYGADMWKYVIQAFEADHPEYNVVANMSNTVWNEYVMSITFIKDPTKYTLSAGINELMNDAKAGQTLKFAALIIAMLPILIIYAIFQKPLQNGLSSSDGVKG